LNGDELLPGLCPAGIGFDSEKPSQVSAGSGEVIGEDGSFSGGVGSSPEVDGGLSPAGLSPVVGGVEDTGGVLSPAGGEDTGGDSVPDLGDSVGLGDSVLGDSVLGDSVGFDGDSAGFEGDSAGFDLAL
jgi:hypothetical protein